MIFRGTGLLGCLLAAFLPCVHGEQVVRGEAVCAGSYGQSLGGKQGKNIYVWDDDTLIVVYCQPSGDPDNIYLLWIAYSHDGGDNWENAVSTIGPGMARRIYPGVICPKHTLVPYLTYQHALHDGTAYVSSDLYFSMDEFFPYMLYTPCLVAPGHWWAPSIITTSNGDTVLISAADKNHPGTTNNAYLFRSTHGGVGWPEPPVLTIDTQGNPFYEDLDPPRIVLGEGGYIFALFDWIPAGSTIAIPHYLESLDYGATWSQPDTLFPDWPPYPGATCRWYCFDSVLDPDDNCRPHCTVSLAAGNYELGDIWEIHPTQGSPGSWSNWMPTLLAGDGQGATWGTSSSIGKDPWGHLHIVYDKLFVDGPDTFPDIGYRYSTDGGATWADELRITDNPDTECPLELADNVFNNLHMVYGDSISFLKYPNPLVGVEELVESQLPVINDQLLQNSPNPFSHSTTIRYSVASAVGGQPSAVSLSVYDLAGRLVKTLVDEPLPTDHCRRACIPPGRGSGLPTAVLWDGRAEDGSFVPAGVYLCRLSVNSYTETRKLAVLR